MNADLLVCPSCRVATPERVDLRTIAREGDADVLACACGRRHPIVDGVPIVVGNIGAFMRTEATAVVERDLPLPVAQELAGGGDDAPYTRLLEHVGIYLDAHWGDRAAPAGAFGLAAVVERIRALPRVERGVELGCSAGRIVAELARVCDHVVGLELQFATLRRARRLLAGESLAYVRRTIGWHYTPAQVAAGELAATNVTLVCGTALDPPLIPQSFDRVVALNLLDSVPHPRRLLAVMDGLCAPGGELVIASPYAWQSATVPDDERFGGGDPAAALVAHLTAGGRYVVEDEAELPWAVRRDARSTVHYQTHYVRARKR